MDYVFILWYLFNFQHYKHELGGPRCDFFEKFMMNINLDLLRTLYLTLDFDIEIDNLHDPQLQSRGDNSQSHPTAKSVCGVGSVHYTLATQFKFNLVWLDI